MQLLSHLGSELQTHLSNSLWLYRDYNAMYNNNKLRYKHTGRVHLLKKNIPSPRSLCSLLPKITLLMRLFHILFPVQLYWGILWFMILFLYVDGAVSWGGTWRVGWDGSRQGTLWFSAKVNKELSYHTICCLWSVTHGSWAASRNFTCHSVYLLEMQLTYCACTRSRVAAASIADRLSAIFSHHNMRLIMLQAVVPLRPYQSLRHAWYLLSLSSNSLSC